ncbi:queuine tRNA-ribosyltransferase subunit QTRTD1-like protein [Dinothrombium tinctorium]|uniref:Queuine tRNA-ribosyltransferase accessory subunit 2 n=1 Tax=Dinothrombium tinctorium TaxID=1965070 RepID=A0A3S4QUU0_9ACAR|nr:queuine tRNA-ribosyltransferase subunit QTRTD1-like protein [Dinothrombium tinctorium]RWS08401.1 queuine tRNA-ribosyltransferase subunit QTRTD1-like protein [Dinothrombium tinctorium]RWS10170.1 queuine tRNA-ribosyltransferase subunit QTRTD1-like protein [Dinothrombium tinctorium]
MEFFIEKGTGLPKCGRFAKLRVKAANESKANCESPNVYKTPFCLQYTVNGMIPHLTRELSGFLDDDNSPLMVPLPTVIMMKHSLQKFGFGFAKFANVKKDRPFILTICDPLQKSKTGFNDKNGVTIWTPSGRRQINSENFLDLISIFKPSLCQPLCDSDTPMDTSKKRLRHSVTRTLSYLDDCASLSADSIFGTIEGGYDLNSRLFSAKETAARKVGGFIFDGFQTIDNENKIHFKIEEVKSILKEVLDLLPEAKPRAMFGVFDPETVLALFESGIDIFDSSYAVFLSENGRALTFNDKIDRFNLKYETLDLKSVQYKREFTVISGNCSCYSCKNEFTKAYINHLLNTKEMLAYVLLMLHNLHNYFEFFRQLRLSLSDNI